MDHDPRIPDIERLNGIFYELAEQLNLSSFTLKGICIRRAAAGLESFIRHDAENMKRYYETTGFVLKPVMLEERFCTKWMATEL